MSFDNVFLHPWMGGLFEDSMAATLLGSDAQLDNMLAVEIAYAQALGSSGAVSAEIATGAVQAMSGTQFDKDKLREGMARDGVVVPEMVRILKANADARFHPAIHTGMTSQDVIDTALVLSLVGISDLFSDRLNTLDSALDKLKHQFGSNTLMGRTRMQAAVPIAVVDRVQSWCRPIADHTDRLAQVAPRLLRLQMGGAVGNRADLGENGQAVAEAMAKTLDLACPANSWHSNRDNIAEFAGWLSLVAGSLAKMGQDILLLSQQGIDEIALSGGGGSSAMPHKQNPIQAELLVTLGRFNAIQLAGMHQSVIHEQERSGSAWALEWMILPQMIMATGCSLLTATKLCESVKKFGNDSK